MADVDGTLINGITYDPLRENATGQLEQITTTDPEVEDANGIEVFNSTEGGGGGATVVRQNPELTRTAP